MCIFEKLLETRDNFKHAQKSMNIPLAALTTNSFAAYS